MFYNEADTRAKLLEPAIRTRGWTEDLIKREETAGAIEIADGKPRRRKRGRVDVTLRVKVSRTAAPLALALIEAKSEEKPPTHGLEQAKRYGRALNVPFVYTSNGHQFVEYDHFTGLTTGPAALVNFPSPTDLQRRYERAMGFALTDEAARPLLVPYATGDTRRYYQDAAIRAVLERIARGEKRMLLALATGSGKTFIAVNLLKRVHDAGQLRRALFLCDRDEIRRQGLQAFQNVFGADAAEVKLNPDGLNNARNARIHIATYQTLGIDQEGDASFLTTHYPEAFFSHVVVDECHRSAFGKWSAVLTRNKDAVQIGLTATPRQLRSTDQSPEDAEADAEITRDNLRYFGEAAYAYDMSQGNEDGYLALCEIVRRELFLDKKAEPEEVTGVELEDLKGKTIREVRTGAYLVGADVRSRWEAGTFEKLLLMPDRVNATCADLFQNLVDTGGPEQKTIVFCASDAHADRVAAALNNLYAGWRARTPGRTAEPYAFKCTHESGGNEMVADLRGAATTTSWRPPSIC